MAVSKEKWRQAGAKESVGVLSGEALRQCLQAAFSGRSGIQEEAILPPGSSRDPSHQLVVEDDEGFDCRVGDRARRRKRVAHSTFDGDSPEHDPKSGLTASGADKKRGRPPTLQPAAKGKKLAPSNLSKAARGPVPKARASLEASPGKAALSPGKLPPGWQLLMKKRPVGRQVDKLYFSPEGVRFNSWKRVVEHCIFAGVPLPHDESDDDEDTVPASTAQVRSWLLAAAAAGSLPKARQFQYAALRARQALSIAPNDVLMEELNTDSN